MNNLNLYIFLNKIEYDIIINMYYNIDRNAIYYKPKFEKNAFYKCCNVFNLLLIILVFFSPLLLLLLLIPNKQPSTIYKLNPIKNEIFTSYRDLIISYNRTIDMPNYSEYMHTTTYMPSNCSWKQDTKINTRKPNSFIINNMYKIGHTFQPNYVPSCDSYYTSNAIVIYRAYYHNIWKPFEDFINSKSYKPCRIISAPKYDLSNYIIDYYKNKLWIPIGFYKIIMCNNHHQSFYIPHKQNIHDFRKYMTNEIPYFISK